MPGTCLKAIKADELRLVGPYVCLPSDSKVWSEFRYTAIYSRSSKVHEDFLFFFFFSQRFVSLSSVQFIPPVGA